MKPGAVLIHVTDVQAALMWYREVFPMAQLCSNESGGPAILQIDGFFLELVVADDKVANGKSGSVLYWSVANLDITLDRFLDHGAKLYRGPMLIENGLAMCQIEDPFGNLIGLRGVMDS